MGFAPTSARFAPLVMCCLCCAFAPGAAGAAEPTNADPAATTAPDDSTSPSDPEPIDATAPAAGTTMTPAAKLYYDRGLQLFAARNFADAVRAFEQGFAIDPRREFLFAQAQALRLAGACQRAIPLYRRFLDSDPTVIQIEAARLGIDRCAPDRTATNAGPTPTAPPSPTIAPAAPPTAVAAPPQPWWRDTWAGLAVGAGVAALAVGASFELSSRQARDDAQSPAMNDYQRYQRLWDSARQRRTIAVATGITGAALLLGGGFRWFVLHRRQRDGATMWTTTTTAAGFVPLPGGGALSWEATF